MIPPVFLLAGLGVSFCYAWLARQVDDRHWPRRLPGAVTAAILLWTGWNGYHTYFDLWARDAHVARAFQADLVDIAEEMKSLPATTPKYLAWAADGEIENGVPADVQPIAFLTRSYTLRQRQETNFHYLSPRDFATPGGGRLTGKALCEAFVKQPLAGRLICLDNELGQVYRLTNALPAMK
jgi:hypothetical protein